MIGCQTVPGSQTSNSSTQKLQEETLWSPTLHWSGARFRFELRADEKNPKPQFERGRQGDILRVGDLEIELIRTRFRIAGVMYRWDPTSIIWIHRTPTKGRSFYRQEGPMQMTWISDGKNPVVEEQRADGSMVWTVGPARVTRDKDGTVHYQGRSRDQTRSGPWKILIDQDGKLIGQPQ